MIAARAEIIVGVRSDQEPFGRGRRERHMQASVAPTMARARAEHAIGTDARASIDREEAAALPERVEEAFAEGLSPELEAALATLSAGEREVLALRIVLELDGEAAARVLGISPTAVSTRLSRALKRLEERVNEG